MNNYVHYLRWNNTRNNVLRVKYILFIVYVYKWVTSINIFYALKSYWCFNWYSSLCQCIEKTKFKYLQVEFAILNFYISQGVNFNKKKKLPPLSGIKTATFEMQRLQGWSPPEVAFLFIKINAVFLHTLRNC